MKRFGSLVLAAFAIAAFAFAQQPPLKPDVLLITIDTLRADRLGCYGYAAASTPNIDALAGSGVVFTNAVSHVPLTRPSHISIFTGLYPFKHGIRDNIAASLPASIPTLAELLKKQGYTTAAFVSSFVINAQSGLNRGFDVYDDRFNPDQQPTEFALNLEKRAGETYSEFAEWFARKPAKPYFAWVHFYDPHFPYEPPPPYAARFKERPYDGEIAYTDEIVGKVLKLAGPNTLVILVSDHGESLGEHGEGAHSYFIYDATLHVPMILRWPGHLKPARIGMQSRLVDLFPTLLELVGVAAPATSGASLKPWLLDPQKADPQWMSYSETLTPYLHFGWSQLLGVRGRGWKYVDAPRSELYDLAKDPKELTSVIASNSARSSEMKKWLSASGALAAPQAQAAPELDPETLEKLASLGYAGVNPGPHPPGKGALADPKDKLEDFKTFNLLIREGIDDFRAERYTDAARKFQALRDRENPSFEVHYYLGRSLLRLKSYDKARTEIQLALQKLPHFLPAYRDLSDTYEAQGNLPKAEEALQQGLVISPNQPSLAQPLAWLYQKQKKVAAAEKLLTSELKDYPDDLEARYRLGALYRDTNRAPLAEAQFREILKRAPQEAEAHNQVGMLLGVQGRNTEAAVEFAAALKLAPGNDNYRRNLAKVQESTAATPQVLRFRIIQTKSRASAETILRKLNAGEDWDALARSYSIHPSARSGQPVLETTAADLDPVLANTLRALKAAQVSLVVETKAGFFLLRKEE